MVKEINEGYRAWNSDDLAHHLALAACTFSGNSQFDHEARTTIKDVAQELGINMTIENGEHGLLVNAYSRRSLSRSGFFVRSNFEIADALSVRIQNLEDLGLDVNTPQGRALLIIARRFRIVE